LSALSSLNFLQSAFPSQSHKPEAFRSSSARNKEGLKEDGTKRRGIRREPKFSESSDEEDFTNIPSEDMTLENETVISDTPTRRSRKGRSPAARR
jgi:hypothetical protein